MTIRLRARDAFYSDYTKHVADGAEFTVESETRAKQLVDRGLAEPVTEPVKAEAEPALPKPRGRRKAA